MHEARLTFSKPEQALNSFTSPCQNDGKALDSKKRSMRAHIQKSTFKRRWAKMASLLAILKGHLAVDRDDKRAFRAELSTCGAFHMGSKVYLTYVGPYLTYLWVVFRCQKHRGT